MQTLLDVVQEFTTWCGMTINVKKTFMLVIDKDRKRRGSMPEPDLRINGERLKTLDINDACRCLGYWGTGNGDMSATREVVREKARVARDLIKGHLLMPELSAELIAQKGIGAFRFSTALIEWLQSELESLQKSGCKRMKTNGTYHGQLQILYTPFQLQRVAMRAPCHQDYSCRPCCSTLTNTCGMKMSSKKLCSAISTHIDRVALQLIY